MPVAMSAKCHKRKSEPLVGAVRVTSAKEKPWGVTRAWGSGKFALPLGVHLTRTVVSRLCLWGALVMMLQHINLTHCICFRSRPPSRGNAAGGASACRRRRSPCLRDHRRQQLELRLAIGQDARFQHLRGRAPVARQPLEGLAASL